MIITCPCEKKQFKIDDSLIPQEGRELQCGSCERVWFYKPKNESKDLLKLNENISCLLYTSPSPRDLSTSRMPSSA